MSVIDSWEMDLALVEATRARIAAKRRGVVSEFAALPPGCRGSRGLPARVPGELYTYRDAMRAMLVKIDFYVRRLDRLTDPDAPDLGVVELELARREYHRDVCSLEATAVLIEGWDWRRHVREHATGF